MHAAPRVTRDDGAQAFPLAENCVRNRRSDRHHDRCSAAAAACGSEAFRINLLARAQIFGSGQNIVGARGKGQLTLIRNRVFDAASEEWIDDQHAKSCRSECVGVRDMMWPEIATARCFDHCWHRALGIRRQEELRRERHRLAHLTLHERAVVDRVGALEFDEFAAKAIRQDEGGRCEL